MDFPRSRGLSCSTRKAALTPGHSSKAVSRKHKPTPQHRVSEQWADGCRERGTEGSNPSLSSGESSTNLDKRTWTSAISPVLWLWRHAPLPRPQSRLPRRSHRVAVTWIPRDRHCRTPGTEEARLARASLLKVMTTRAPDSENRRALAGHRVCYSRPVKPIPVASRSARSSILADQGIDVRHSSAAYGLEPRLQHPALHCRRMP
jgi:hypothetical protein